MVSKRDDRSDNAEKLSKIIKDTKENIHDSEASLEFTDSDLQKKAIQNKNQHRKESIQALENEVKDETKQ
ncbi:small acid-soluble spore protein Tlp [Guptibacillus hwajinpoensis]|uniref:small acid-soluble spore protein Tlp n=1 Tax=Guptibacillus hwajinpoensis TaxID=208199 RepID=UPI001CFD11C1|nr:small acid-soluble spore protein Tlp [Pseudalkalibacillus hwajinpoensis]WLR59858.1 small acid-soluble spore protein Tlp [Pseudalkalibacillus hwajinpoensis]